MNRAYKVDTGCQWFSPGSESRGRGGGGEQVSQVHGGEWWLVGYNRQVAVLGGERSILGPPGPG